MQYNIQSYIIISFIGLDILMKNTEFKLFSVYLHLFIRLPGAPMCLPWQLEKFLPELPPLEMLDFRFSNLTDVSPPRFLF